MTDARPLASESCVAGAMHEVHKVDQQETLDKIVAAFTNAISDAQTPDE